MGLAARLKRSQRKMVDMGEQEDRVEQPRARGRQASQRAAQVRQRVDEQAGDGNRERCPQAERAARSARQATDLARQGYEMAADAQDSAARAHDLVAEGLQIRAKGAGDDREALLQRAEDHHRSAVKDRAEAAEDRATAEGLS